MIVFGGRITRYGMSASHERRPSQPQRNFVMENALPANRLIPVRALTLATAVFPMIKANVLIPAFWVDTAPANRFTL